MNRPPPPFLTARWIHLAMLNYEVDPRVLSDHVPAGTELDLWEGRCFVTMVGLQFRDTRVVGLPIPFHRDFDEVNLRFYVRREANGEVRRGVVFIREIVARRAIAWVARAVYNENYVTMPMAHEDRLESPDQPRITYTWKHRGRWNRLGLGVAGPAYLPRPDSEEAFIADHYWGYTQQRDGTTLEYRVEHPRWEIWPGVQPVLDCDVAELYDREFTRYLSGVPDSAFVARGSEVLVRRGVPVEDER